MIMELLGEGPETAKTARQLADFFDCKIRDITRQIQKERREGAPICALCTGDIRGYFLPANKDEFNRYCRSLERRKNNLGKTLDALRTRKKP